MTALLVLLVLFGHTSTGRPESHVTSQARSVGFNTRRTGQESIPPFGLLAYLRFEDGCGGCQGGRIPPNLRIWARSPIRSVTFYVHPVPTGQGLPCDTAAGRVYTLPTRLHPLCLCRRGEVFACVPADLAADHHSSTHTSMITIASGLPIRVFNGLGVGLPILVPTDRGCSSFQHVPPQKKMIQHSTYMTNMQLSVFRQDLATS